MSAFKRLSYFFLPIPFAAVAVAQEKSIRIGWTYADAFKNVRKRLRFKKRDYLFATKDYPSALEFMTLCQDFADLHDYARSIVSHGEQILKLEPGGATGFTLG